MTSSGDTGGASEAMERQAGDTRRDTDGPDEAARAGQNGGGEKEALAAEVPSPPESGTADDGSNVRAAQVDVHPPTRLELVTYGAIRSLTRAIAKVYVRLRVDGAERIPQDEPFVLAPVHRSNLDFLLVSFTTRRRMRYMGKASLWKIGWIGRIFNMLGAFPVHRGTADRAAMRTCLQVLEENREPVVMFPEGTRRSGEKVQQIFDGPAYVAARAGVPLVPVGIGGSDAAMPIGAKLIRPRKVTLVVGEPIRLPVDEKSGRVPRRVVREVTEQLESTLQDLYDEAQRLSG
jgi:1-acyl-sn-glycerol-3-phosphate acyltransferase